MTNTKIAPQKNMKIPVYFVVYGEFRQTQAIRMTFLHCATHIKSIIFFIFTEEIRKLRSLLLKN